MEGDFDGNGHGTHVAGTILGTGAASGGKYKGVAPDAKLMYAKVLTSQGYGSFSDVMEGSYCSAFPKSSLTFLSGENVYPPSVEFAK